MTPFDIAAGSARHVHSYDSLTARCATALELIRYTHLIVLCAERWIFVSTSPDGTTWDPAELALSPDWRDPVGFQVISSVSTITARTVHGDTLTVGWLPVFHTLSQTIDMQLTASDDGGLTWWRPERRSAVAFRELGAYGGGMMWPYRLFVPDRDDAMKLHAYFSGCQVGFPLPACMPYCPSFLHSRAGV